MQHTYAVKLASSLLIFCGLLLATGMTAQEDLRAFYVKGNDFLDSGQRDSARFYAERLDSALLVADIQEGTNYGLSELLNGKLHSSRYRCDQALPHLYSAIDLLKEAPGEQNALAQAYLAAASCNKDMNTRIALLDKANATFTLEGDSLNIAKCCLDLSIAYYRKGNLEQSREYGKRGLDHLSTFSDQDRLTLRLEFAIGRYYAGIGNDEAAIYYMRRAFDRLLQSNPRDPSVFVITDELGQLYYANGNYEEGIAVYRQPIDDYTGEKSTHRIYAESSNWMQLGDGYAQLGMNAQAEAAILTGIESVIPGYGKDDIYVAYPNMFLAKFYLHIGEEEKAQMAIDEFTRLLGMHAARNHPDYSKLTLLGAQILAQEKRLAEAVQYIDSGIVGIGYSHDPEPSFQNVYRYDVLADLFNQRTKSLALLKEVDENYSRVYREQVEDHIAFLDTLQVQRLDPSSRMKILESHYHVYNKAIDLALTDYRESGSEADLLRGLEFAEKSKDQLYTQFLIRNKLKIDQEIPENLLNQERLLNSELSAIEIELYKTPDSDSSTIAELNRKKVELQVALDDLYLKLNNPSVVSSVMAGESNLKEQIAQSTQDAIVIEIFEGEEQDHFFIMGEELSWITIPNQDLPGLTEALTDYRNSDEWKQSASSIENALYPVLQLLTGTTHEIVVIPDGKWSMVPFDILEGTDGQMLLENHTIRYNNSLKNRNLSVGVSKKARKGLAAFAPEYAELRVTAEDTAGHAVFAELVRSGEYQLPGALKEATEISSIMNGTVYTKGMASKSEFQAVAPNYSVLHLSMHAILEPGDPAYSRLVFTPTSDGEDNYLFATELSKLDLNAELAVLSACNTGTGKSIKGEGIMSLARSFQYAGVPGTVHSLWKVPDASTSEIMVSFYEGLNSGLDVAEALRLAKKQYVENCRTPELAHPYYWAGFVAHGKTDPVLMNDEGGIGRYLVLALVAIAVVFTFASRRKRKRPA